MNFTVESYEKHGYTPQSFIRCQCANLQRDINWAGYEDTLLTGNEFQTCVLTILTCLKHAQATEVVRDDLRLPYILLVRPHAHEVFYRELHVSFLFRLL